ncbi:hypothetical protein KLP28_00630 [Nocardioidaceae bacterium]|nr:hypothetical protein KLP28_00630 [Nocardioidaceae bacterium]
MSRDLGDQPEPTVDESQPPRAPGRQDNAPTAKDLSSPREEPPLPTDQPRAAQTEDSAVSQKLGEQERSTDDEGPDSGDPEAPSEAPG